MRDTICDKKVMQIYKFQPLHLLYGQYPADLTLHGKTKNENKASAQQYYYNHNCTLRHNSFVLDPTINS